jgi:hypothetical protein
MEDDAPLLIDPDAVKNPADRHTTFPDDCRVETANRRGGELRSIRPIFLGRFCEYWPGNDAHGDWGDCDTNLQLPHHRKM